MSDTLTNSLLDQIEELENRIGMMEDTQAIRNLVNAHGYYSDKLLHHQVVDCFAEDATLQMRNGLWRGKESIKRFWHGWIGKGFADGGPMYGHLLDHCFMQDIIHVDPDRQTGRMRYRNVSFGGTHESREQIANFWSAYMEGGIAEDLFVKEDGVWKYKHWNYNTLWQCDFHDGWDKNIRPASRWSELFPENPNGPDEFVPWEEIWPNTLIVDFHYPHPVTGEEWVPREK